VWLGVAIDADRPIRTTVVVQEGGYVLDTVGALVLAVLEGLDEAR
jgi:acetoin utilization deacetylase AcuC-like enzyme